MLFGDVVLLFSGRRRSGVAPDGELQEALRTRLRVVESNSQDVVQLFKVRQKYSCKTCTGTTDELITIDYIEYFNLLYIK